MTAVSQRMTVVILCAKSRKVAPGIRWTDDVHGLQTKEGR